MSPSDSILFRLLKRHTQPRVLFLSLLSICFLGASLTFFVASIGRPYMGLSLSLNDDGWKVASLDVNGWARRAGVKPGDRPTEINGQLAGQFLERYTKNGVVLGMSITRLTVIDERGQFKLVALEEGSSSVKSIIDQIARFVVSFTFWVIGFYCLMKRPRNMAALLLCLSGLVFGLVLSANMASTVGITTAYQLQIAASILGPWLLVHLFLVLPEERSWARDNRLAYFIYVPAAVTLVLFFLVGYVDGQPVQWFRTVRFFEYAVGFLATVIVAAINYFTARSFRTRQQMKIVFVGCLAAIIPFLVIYLLPIAIWGRSALPPEFGILLIGFIPLGMGYAVVTQKLMDIDVIIRRGVIYGLVTMIMAVILATAIFFVLALRKSLGVPEEILVALVLGGIATALFGPAKKGIEALVDRLFYKDRYDYRQIINSLSASLRSCKDFIDMSRLVVGACIQTLNLAGGCLFAKTRSGSFEISASQGTFADPGKQKHLEALISQRNARTEFPNSASTTDPDVSFIIRLVAGEKEVGVLYLSKKASRQEFSADDMYLLQGVTSVAAIALGSAALVRDVSMRDTFVSIASHELRNPLTTIVGYAELLQHREVPESTRKRWLKDIVNSAKRITAMADDLLNVTRIQSGKLTFKLERVKLCDILEENVSIIRESTNKHEFIVDITPSLPDVTVDRDKFGQVMMNLLSNAVKYSPQGGRITLSAHGDPFHHRVIVSVRDEGIGIGPEDKDSLFTTFHRIQRPDTQGIKGSGLGLYIVKEWTEAMGGKVWLESELNKGSTFFIAVPTGLKQT